MDVGLSGCGAWMATAEWCAGTPYPGFDVFEPRHDEDRA